MPRRIAGTSSGPVVVGVHRVVDEPGVHLEVAQRALVAQPLVGPPLLAGVDHRLGRERRLRELDVAVGRREPLGDGGLGRAVGAEVGGVEGRQLPGGAGRDARVDDGELHVGRSGPLRDDLDLHPVDLADEHLVGAGPRTLPLTGVRVGSVVVVVLHLGPARPRAALLRADLDLDLVVRDHVAVLPGEPDGAVPGHLLRRAGDPLHAARRDLRQLRRERPWRHPRAGGSGQAHLAHGRVDRSGRHDRGHRLRLRVRRHRHRREPARRAAADDVGRPVAVRDGPEVDGDDPRGRRQHGEDHAEDQQLLARGHEPCMTDGPTTVGDRRGRRVRDGRGLGRGRGGMVRGRHERSAPVRGEESHRTQLSHQSHDLGRGSE
jgi:hypothetical protein